MPNQVSWYAIDTDIAEGMHFDAWGRLALLQVIQPDFPDN